jgi:radical S-adenosyl methionine domain-containing protein 2
MFRERNVTPFLISSEEFNSFLDRHRELECMVPENNDEMRDSYLMVDERMCFLDSSKGAKIPSRSILGL